MKATCLDLGVPPPTTACFTSGIWRPKVPGSPIGISSKISCQKVYSFELSWHLKNCWFGNMSLRGRELHYSPYLGIDLKFLTWTGYRWQGFRRGASFFGRRSEPALCWTQPVPDGSAAGPPQDTAEPFKKTGGTSVKTCLGPENTDGRCIRGGNEGAAKGGMNKNNDKRQREHHG